jgi:hypothetical protein
VNDYEFDCDGRLVQPTHEQLTLGGLLASPATVLPVLHKLNLKPEEIVAPWTRALLEGAYDLDLDDKPITVRAVLQRIADEGRAYLFDHVGGGAYAWELVDACITPSTTAWHIKMLRREAFARFARVLGCDVG